MTPLLIGLFVLSVVCDVAGQLCFKLGAEAIPDFTHGFRLTAFWRAVAGSPWLWAGIAIYVVEMAVWLAILARAPLSLAFPIASLNYCGILLASHFILGERVNRRRWLGAGLITVGVVIVGANG